MAPLSSQVRCLARSVLSDPRKEQYFTFPSPSHSPPQPHDTGTPCISPDLFRQSPHAFAFLFSHSGRISVHPTPTSSEKPSLIPQARVRGSHRPLIYCHHCPHLSECPSRGVCPGGQGRSCFLDVQAPPSTWLSLSECMNNPQPPSVLEEPGYQTRPHRWWVVSVHPCLQGTVFTAKA